MKTTWVQIRIDPDEKQVLERAAKAYGLSLSSWARVLLRQAAKRENAKRLLTHHKATP